MPTFVLPDELDRAGTGPDLEREALRLESTYDMRSLRDVWRTDWPLDGQSEQVCLDRTVRHYRALERLFDEIKPDVVVPEVGSETFRTAAHHIALERGIDVLFLFYTVFPKPLRLYANTMHAPIAAPEELRELEPHERERGRSVHRGVHRRRHADPRLPPAEDHGADHARLRGPGRGVTHRRPAQRVRAAAPVRRELRPREGARRARVAARTNRSRRTTGRSSYFPLHVTYDYKIKRIIPHCVDQAAIIELVAASLPQGIDVVIKEHPMSIGRNPLKLLRRLARRRATCGWSIRTRARTS